MSKAQDDRSCIVENKAVPRLFVWCPTLHSLVQQNYPQVYTNYNSVLYPVIPLPPRTETLQQFHIPCTIGTSAPARRFGEQPGAGWPYQCSRHVTHPLDVSAGCPSPLYGGAQWGQKKLDSLWSNNRRRARGDWEEIWRVAAAKMFPGPRYKHNDYGFWPSWTILWT